MDNNNTSNHEMVQSTSMIQSMCAALRNLDYVTLDNRSLEYQEIYDKIKHFIENNCNHHIVYDSIDTCTDCSKTIKYCIHCEKTFD